MRDGQSLAPKTPKFAVKICWLTPIQFLARRRKMGAVIYVGGHVINVDGRNASR